VAGRWQRRTGGIGLYRLRSGPSNLRQRGSLLVPNVRVTWAAFRLARLSDQWQNGGHGRRQRLLIVCRAADGEQLATAGEMEIYRSGAYTASRTTRVVIDIHGNAVMTKADGVGPGRTCGWPSSFPLNESQQSNTTGVLTSAVAAPRCSSPVNVLGSHRTDFFARSAPPPASRLHCSRRQLAGNCVTVIHAPDTPARLLTILTVL